MSKTLRIDSSARTEGSITRRLLDQIEDRISGAVTRRDLASEALPQIDQDWVGANFTLADARNDAQKAKLAQSDALVAELQAADTVLIGAPIYNFGVPAALKAWVDLIARAGVTFRYTENGPEGLLTGKRAIVVVASGGTPVGSDIDFATPYLRQALRFVGITDVTFVTADAMGQNADEALARANGQIEALAA